MQTDRIEIEIATEADTDIHDLTPEVRRFVAGTGIREGTVLVFTPGSTAGITTIEFEPGAVSDLRRAIDQIAASDGAYEHNERWGDGNGYSHVRAALLGPSLTLPIAAGEPITGTWQQIVLCDFDNRPRRRRVLIQAQGE